MSRRAWIIAFAVLVALVYGGVVVEIAHAEFQLVNDFRPFAMSRMGFWPTHMAETLFDFTREGAWLYRPFPDAMEWMLSTWFRGHPGAWHLLVFALRVVTVLCAFLIVRACSSAPAAVAAAAYLAFFPAVPEINLLRAENWLMPVLAFAFLGWIRLEKGSRSWYAATAVAFVLATLAKEIMAPLLAVLLMVSARHYWRRGRGGRAMLAAMSIALVWQAIRFFLMFADPYGGANATIVQNAYWVAKVVLLPTTAFPLFSLVLALCFAAGANRVASLSRNPETRVFAIGVATLFFVALGMAVAAPYHAIRYVYPATLFAVPLLAFGFDEIGRLAGERTRDVLAAASMVLLAVFGGAALWAQAASARASSRADWELLRTLATAFASGRDVVVIDDADFERSFWMRAELVGADPRWPFLSYIARRYAAGQPVAWPPARPAPVNLTSTPGMGHSAAQFRLVPKNSDFAQLTHRAIVVQAIPQSDSPPPVPPSLEIAERFDYRHGSHWAGALERFHTLAQRLNGRHRFERDLGETEFPGHYWVVYQRASS